MEKSRIYDDRIDGFVDRICLTVSAKYEDGRNAWPELLQFFTEDSLNRIHARALEREEYEACAMLLKEFKRRGIKIE